MNRPDDDPVPIGIFLELDETFRVLEALEDSIATFMDTEVAPGLVDELATVIRLLHGKLGLAEGGLQ